MRRREPGPAELEALDPSTGESLTSPLVAPSSDATARLAERVQRRRFVARVFAVLAFSCVAAAGYFGATIAQLRGVERTWRTAMAVDRARAEADTRVLLTLEEVGGEDQYAALAPLSRIGDEVMRHLLAAERELDERRIFDSKVSDLRDEMVAALRFRRFQLTPQRAQMGNTPLQRVDASIEAQLDRWNLEPLRVEAPVLRSPDRVLADLRRFTDEPTGQVLFATMADQLIVVDVDDSLARARSVDGPVIRLLPAPGGVAVYNGAEVIVYSADVDAAPIVRVPAATGPVHEVADGSQDLWVVSASDGSSGATTVRRFRPVAGESLQLPIEVPPGRLVVGGAGGRLVLDNGGLLELWTPPTATAAASTTALTNSPARFLAGDDRRVLWQGPLPFGPPDSDGYLHRLDLQTGERELMALPPTDAATGTLTSDGAVAVVAGPLAGRIGSVLVAPASTVALGGTGGPRALVGRDVLRWSADGELLFWLTPDGRIAMRRGNASSTMRAALSGLDRLTVMGR